MQIQPHALPGVYEITLQAFPDPRGFFLPAYDQARFEQAGIQTQWIRENHSRSTSANVIRGLHFQFSPYTEAKLIRVARGAILDVFVDLRVGSPTFGQWGAVELSEANLKVVLIPRGFAHGFCTLTDQCDVLYKVDNGYAPQYEGGIIWNDPTLKLPWPTQTPLLSEKDSRLGTFTDFVQQHGGLKG